VFRSANDMLRPYCYAAYYLGARQANLRQLRVRDIDFERGLVMLSRTKNGRPHSVPLHPRLAGVLRPLCAGKRSDDRLLAQYAYRQ
jgi:integrase